MRDCVMDPIENCLEWQEEEIKRLKKALRKINDSIVCDGNSITMNISIFELKGIVETALDDDEE